MGPLVLLGGEQGGDTGWAAPLAAAAGGTEVLVLPTGAAYERPERAVERARHRFAGVAPVRRCNVLSRADAEDARLADQVARARFVYLCGSSPLHLRSVLKDSQVLQALLAAWRSGAVVAGASGAATVLSDPMVDPRGGAFTVGLGLVRDLAVVCGGELDDAQLRRTLALAPASCAVVALADAAALVRDPDGTWQRAGSGDLTVYVGGATAGLDALAGKAVHPALDRDGAPA